MSAKSNMRRKLIRQKEDPFITQLTPQFLYICGWLWSDGHIRTDPPRVAIELVRDDMNDIRSLFPSQFNYYQRDRANRKPQSSLISGRADVAQFFSSIGYVDKIRPDTSLLQNQYSHYWFRGVIDGDGNWYLGKNGHTRQFSVSSHYDHDWSYLTDQLDQLDCKYSVRQQETIRGSYSYVRMCSRSSIQNLQRFLYPAGFDFGLRRKYDKSVTLL